MREPIFDNPGDGHVMPLGGITLEEVRAAASDARPLYLSMAYVTRGREAAFAFKLEHIRDVCEYEDGGFLFVGDAVQLVTKVLHRHEIETTMRLEGHSSVCTVLVMGTGASMTFNTTITITDITGVFPENWEE